MGIDQVTAMRERLEAFKDSQADIIQFILMSLESLIVDLNTEDQLFEKGITSEGEQIITYAPYSDVTIAIKEVKGQPVDRVTLRDEGDFHQSFRLQKINGGVEIIATDAKTVEILFSYGDEVLGLTEENLEEVVFSYLLPELIDKLRSLLGV